MGVMHRKAPLCSFCGLGRAEDVRVERDREDHLPDPWGCRDTRRSITGPWWMGGVPWINPRELSTWRGWWRWRKRQRMERDNRRDTPPIWERFPTTGNQRTMIRLCYDHAVDAKFGLTKHTTINQVWISLRDCLLNESLFAWVSAVGLIYGLFQLFVGSAKVFESRQSMQQDWCSTKWKGVWQVRSVSYTFS